MTMAQQIIDAKGDEVATLPPSATVLEAAQLMNERHIGAVLVMAGEDLVGIFTERDVMRRVVAKGLDPKTTSLDDVMTSPVACASPGTTCEELRKVMREKRIRHVPVVDEHQVLRGMISIGDLNRNEIDVQIETIRYLEQFMSVQ